MNAIGKEKAPRATGLFRDGSNHIGSKLKLSTSRLPLLRGSISSECVKLDAKNERKEPVFPTDIVVVQTPLKKTGVPSWYKHLLERSVLVQHLSWTRY